MSTAAPPPASGKAAAAKGKKTDAAAEKHADGGVSIIALVIVTVIAGGLGGAFGTLIPPMPQVDVEHKLAEVVKTGNETIVVPLAPITTNLAGGGRTWIRIEASAVMQADVGDKASVLAVKVSEDVVSFLRTVTMEQLEGPSGFQHLTEDLNDRVRLRTEGKVTELLIQSLILE